MESFDYFFRLKELDGYFNFIMFYRRDFDIFTFYGWFEFWSGSFVEAAVNFSVKIELAVWAVFN